MNKDLKINTNKLFSIFLNFSDHLIGIGQYNGPSPENALERFIRSNESLKGYDRDLLLYSIMPIVQIAHYKGIWLFYFNPDLMDKEWPSGNAVLGGHIIQTDPKDL